MYRAYTCNTKMSICGLPTHRSAETVGPTRTKSTISNPMVQFSKARNALGKSFFFIFRKVSRTERQMKNPTYLGLE